MPWEACLNSDKQILYVEMKEGSSSAEVPAIFAAASEVQDISSGWTLIFDQRRSGSLVDHNLEAAARMHRSVKRFLGSNIRMAVLYDPNRPILSANAMTSSIGLGFGKLNSFSDVAKALTWCQLPADYELKSGQSINSSGT